MGKYFEELSKDLASGVSRRQALWRFATGICAAVGALLAGRSASANDERNNVCVEFCRQQGFSGREFGECVSRSAHCPDGYCALFVNGHWVCAPYPINGA